MRYICLKNTHRFWPLIPRIYYGKKFFDWTATLNENCIYEFPSAKMKAWNKLVGISNSMNPRKDSCRFVWKWDMEYKFFRIAVFIERKKEFKNTIYEVGTASPGEQFYVAFDCKETGTYAIFNMGTIKVPFVVNNLAFRLNPYFGGSANKTPHLMTLKIR